MSATLNTVLKFFKLIIEKLLKDDRKFETSISNFLKDKYFPQKTLPLFTAFIPKSIKLIIYFSCISLILFLVKILYPEKRVVSLALVSVLLIMGFLLAIIFLGFMQLLYE